MNRILVESGVYHCISRVNGRLMLLDRSDVKEQFVTMLEKIADFCSMEVLSFCVMGNHFHVLTRETPVLAEVFSDEDLKAKLYLLYGENKGRIHFAFQQTFRERGDEARADQIRERYRRMMGDVSWFMRLLKQRFSIWYNRSNGREGTLWSERFRSVAVEDSDDAIRAMAAYIDLNPVRAGIVADPRDYRWSTAGAAAGGLEFARRGILRVCAIAWDQEQPHLEWDAADAWWRGQLADAAGERRDDEGRISQRGMDKVAREALAGKQSIAITLMRRVRYFSEGAAIGSKAFVRSVVEGERGKKLPLARKSEGVRIPTEAIPRLFSLRQLKEKA